jgi:hypothetical protein
MRVPLMSLFAVLTASISFAEPPTQQVLRVTGDGEWWLYNQYNITKCFPEEYTYTERVPVQESKDVVENGQTVTKTITRYLTESRTATRNKMVMECQQNRNQIEPESLSAFELDGRKISPADLKKRLQGDTLVLVGSCDGAMLPDYYAAVFKPGTIFIRGDLAYVPQPGGPQPGEPAPAPPGLRPPSAASIIDQTTSIRLVAHRTAAPLDVQLFPPTPAPQIVFAARDGADLLKIRAFQESTHPSTVSVKANDSSVSPENTLTVQTTVRHSEITTVPWAALRVSTPEAKDLPLDRVKERLGAGEATVLLSSDGKLVDEFWLQNIKPGVLVLRGVQLGGGMGHYAMPAAMPAPVAYPKSIEAVPPAAPAATLRPDAT